MLVHLVRFDQLTDETDELEEMVRINDGPPGVSRVTGCPFASQVESMSLL